VTAESNRRIEREVRKRRTKSPPLSISSHLPLLSTFAFSSSFIFLMTGSRLASPVVCVVVAGAPLLGIEVWSGSVFAGRVAVAPGEALVWAFDTCTSKSRTPDSSAAAMERPLLADCVEKALFR
jgi:hypothetical protein